WMHQYGEDELLMDIFQRYAHMPFKEYVSLLHIERSVPAQKTDVGDASNEPEPTNTNSKKKTSSERKIEKEKIEQEKRRKQTVRSIYIDLIKIFHPDTEQDEYKKLEKEEISKRLTEAYAKNDLFTLLKLETDYLENDSSRLAGMHPDTLQAYVTMLANQKKEIESALSVLKTENNLIYVEMCRPSSKPEKFLRKVKKEMNEMTGILDNQIAVLQEHDESIKPYLLDDMEKQFRRKNIDALLSDML
ncbi:MAG: molecular chaperone DnaJ, partial [Cytophagales bacterium]|nr:molecular chaperone DnaJ [Cytophaga sp.]